jgi:hypothetical protein
MEAMGDMVGRDFGTVNASRASFSGLAETGPLPDARVSGTSSS